MLSKKIKEKMDELALSPHMVEKKAGLKPSAVQNIIYGRSKNPSISLVQAIADTLGCSIESLMSDKKENKEPSSLSEDTAKRKWDQYIYFECFKMANDIIIKKNLFFSKKDLMELVDDIYDYSIINKITQPDYCFSCWLIDRKDNG